MISQREARRLRQRVRFLEDQEAKRNFRWSSEWPNGLNIASAEWSALDSRPVAIRTARKLGHAVIAVADDKGLVTFMAVPMSHIREESTR